MSTTEAPAYAVVLTAPDPYGTRRIGPFHYQHAADSYATALRYQLTSTAHPDSLTITTGPHDPQQQHTDPNLPRDAHSLAELMEQEDDSADPASRFPDLFSRLLAQYGYESTGLWKAACRYYDMVNAPDEDDDQAQPGDGPCPSNTLHDTARRCILPAGHDGRTHVDHDGYAWTAADAEERRPAVRLDDVFTELAELRKRSGTAERRRNAALGLIGMLLKEADRWACDDAEDEQVLNRLDAADPAGQLDILSNTTILPGNVVAAVTEALLVLDPDLLTPARPEPAAAHP